MTTASDNVFPKLILDGVTSAPAAPADDSWKLYAMPDGIYARSSNSAVGPLGAAGASSAFVGCRVSRTAAQTIGTGTWTEVSFTAADVFDVTGWHDPGGAAPQDVTVPSGGTGYYVIDAWVQFANSTSGTFRMAAILVDATAVAVTSMPFHSNVGINGVVSAGVSLTAASVVTLEVYQDTGGNLNLDSAKLSVMRVGT